MRLFPVFFLFLYACGQETNPSQVRDNPEFVNVSSDGRLIDIIFRAPTPNVSERFWRGQMFTSVAIESFRMAGQGDEHQLPIQTFGIAVPKDMRADLEIVSVSAVQKLQLQHPLAPAASAPRHCSSRDDDSIASISRQQLSPADWVTLEYPDYAGSERLALLHFWPIRPADAASNEVEYIAEVTARIRITPTDGATETTIVTGNNRHIVQDFVLNPQLLSPVSTEREFHDLIIADQSYQAALQPLIDYKQKNGRTVLVEYVNKPSTSAVKAIINKAYSGKQPPAHTTLVGSIDQIPSFRVNSIWSDFSYSLIDSGSKPDLSLGRIPAQNEQELSYYIQKAIVRESMVHPYDEFLLTAGKDTSLGCPQNVDKVAQILVRERPSIHATKLYRSQGATQAQIIGGYNNNPNFIVYDGHGDSTGMIEIPLVIKNIADLHNTAYPIILDIACLNANWPSNGASRRNFAESILLSANVGASGIVAAGGNSGGHEFFQSMATYIARSNVERKIEGRPAREFGHALWAARIESGSGDNQMFGYYGDPAAAIFEAK